MNTDLPAWAQRIVSERNARGWSQKDAVNVLRSHSTEELVSDASLLRQWKRWESGESLPSEFYQPLLAATFGTVTRALFPVQGKRNGKEEITTYTGLDTLEIISKMRASDVDNATLDALRITADRLCSEYPYMPSEQLRLEGTQWLRRVASLQGSRMTLSQHRELLTLAGWLALLVGCVEYDMGHKQAAEATRKAALSLGNEAENGEIQGWAYEMRAWFSLTMGDFRGVIAASRGGAQVAGNHSVAVQLAGQEAKAWARMGDRRQTELALERGRQLLENFEHPENLDHHFVVDPAKFDFYSMDCYRHLGETRIAETLAREVIRESTNYDGTERSPMRAAEARLTLGVTSALDGDVDAAVIHGERALEAPRRSLPSLLFVAQDLTSVLRQKYTDVPLSQDFIERVRTLRST